MKIDQIKQIVANLNSEDNSQIIEEILIKYAALIYDNQESLLVNGSSIKATISSNYFASLNHFVQLRKPKSRACFIAVSIDEFKRALNNYKECVNNPNFNRFNLDGTRLSYTVRFDILQYSLHPQRLLAAVRWIIIAKIMLVNKDLHSAISIIFGLKNLPVERTVKFEYLPPVFCKLFDVLKEILLYNNSTCDIHSDSTGQKRLLPLLNFFLESNEPTIPHNSFLKKRFLGETEQIISTMKLQDYALDEFIALDIKYRKIERYIEPADNSSNPIVASQSQENLINSCQVIADEKIELVDDNIVKWVYLKTSLKRYSSEQITELFPKLKNIPDAIENIKKHEEQINTLLNSITSQINKNKENDSPRSATSASTQPKITENKLIETFADFKEDTDDANYQHNRKLLKKLNDEVKKYLLGDVLDYELLDEVSHKIAETLVRPNPKMQHKHTGKKRISPRDYLWQDTDPAVLSLIVNMLGLNVFCDTSDIDKKLLTGIDAKFIEVDSNATSNTNTLGRNSRRKSFIPLSNAFAEKTENVLEVLQQLAIPPKPKQEVKVVNSVYNKTIPGLFIEKVKNAKKEVPTKGVDLSF